VSNLMVIFAGLIFGSIYFRVIKSPTYQVSGQSLIDSNASGFYSAGIFMAKERVYIMTLTCFSPSNSVPIVEAVKIFA
jgi:hypothetical protein